MTYQEAVRKGFELLEKEGILDAKTDAWLLLSMVCGISRNDYYMRGNESMPKSKQAEYEAVLALRAKRMPLQYITGEQEFMGYRFLVNPNVLIPRQDTEILVEEAAGKIQPGMEFLDLCTGSGCIAVSILKQIPGACATAADISAGALCTAGENARLHGVSLKLVESDLFEQISGRFDVIVSNPPYIPTQEIAGLMAEVRDYEPMEALDGSRDGLLFYRRIVLEGKRHLKSGGYLMFEIGCNQGEAVFKIMEGEGYYGITVKKDLAGLDRVVTGQIAAV